MGIQRKRLGPVFVFVGGFSELGVTPIRANNSDAQDMVDIIVEAETDFAAASERMRLTLSDKGAVVSNELAIAKAVSNSFAELGVCVTPYISARDLGVS